MKKIFNLLPLMALTASAALSAAPGGHQAGVHPKENRDSLTTRETVSADSVPSDSIASGDNPSDSLPGGYNDSIVEVKAEVLRRGTITPVDNDRTRPAQPILHYYDKHGELLPEPVLFLVEEKDTVVSPRSPYPLYNGCTVGVDFLDGLLMAFGQDYGSFGITADVSLHNWFFPVLEVGAGYGDNRPDDGNFHYKAKLSPYVKLGLNYNFLYKSDPKYQVYVGVRAGWSTTRFDITDIDIDNSYWGENVPLQILGQKGSLFFGEAVAGLRVGIYGPFSLGWRLRYRFKFHESPAAQATPWFYPGYGASTPISFQFSAFWRF